MITSIFKEHKGFGKQIFLLAKNELIKTFLAPHKEEIAMFYESHSDRDERGDFIKSFFN